MALTPITLIPEQTGVVTAVAKFEVQQRFLPATLMATNLAGAESVAILFSIDGGLTFEPLSQDGADLTLIALANSLAITSPIFIGVTKTATVGTSGVFIMSNELPNTR